MKNKVKPLSESEQMKAAKEVFDNPSYKAWDSVHVLENGHIYPKNKKASAETRAKELGVKVTTYSRTVIEKWADLEKEAAKKEAENISKAKEKAAADKAKSEKEKKEAAAAAKAKAAADKKKAEANAKG